MKRRYFIVFLFFSLVFSFCFSGFTFAEETRPISWDDVNEDARALRDSYYELWSSNGNFSQLFKSAADIPVKWLTFLVDGSAALSPFNGLIFTKTEEAHKVDYTGSVPKIKAMLDSGEISAQHPIISSDDFADIIHKDNTSYTPKSAETWKLTWRSNPLGRFYESGSSHNPINYIPLSNDSKGYTDFTELYIVPYFRDPDGLEYYSQYQFHIYLQSWEDPNSDVFLGCDVYSYTKDFKGILTEELTGIHIVDLASDHLPYKIAIQFPQNGNTFFFNLYNTNTSYANHRVDTTTSIDVFRNIDSTLHNSWADVYSSDLSKHYSLRSSFLRFDRTLCNVDAESYPVIATLNNPDKDDGVTDVGYIASNDLIRFTYSDIDISKIAKDQIVTINGDTIYNYNITNPETGDTSKFGDYITNNYTYITNNNGSQSGGAGTVGGNVEVGGKIEVGGSVGVDVNVNVNGNGGGAGVTPNPEDFLQGDEVDLTSYYDKAVEDASGVRRFLGVFFDFLPAELLGLLCLLVVVAICCRIFGR